MSYLGGKTRKVTTYGKKQTRIISVHADLSPSRNSPSTSKPLTPARPPLMAKLAQEQSSQPSTPLKASRANVVNTPHPLAAKTPLHSAPKTPHVGALKTPRSAALKTPNAACDDSLSLRQRVARKAIRRRSPGSPKAKPSSPNLASPKPLRSTRKRRGPLTTPKSVRGPRMIVEVEIITKRLRNVVLDKPVRESDDDIRNLLNCSVNKSIIPFSGVFTTPEFAKLLPSGVVPQVTKLGEASYSEVFTVGADDSAVVVKVVPLLSNAGTSGNGKAKVELPDCSEIEDVVREIEITKRMSQVPGGGFVEFLGSFVVEGVYPDQLLEEWDRHREECGTESIRPDSFSASQRYGLIVLANGGQDLESYRFENTRGWVQAAAVFWQVADALARAEEWTEFEHRDLHEGQILITDVNTGPPAPITDYLDPDTTGVRATVIDFGLSRLDMPGKGAVFTPLPQEVYEGVGDQWDVYRAQRDVVAESRGDDAWQRFHASTNALWLHYLVGHLLRSTRTLRKPYARRARPAPPKSSAQVKAELLRTRAEEAWGMLQLVDGAFGATRGREHLSSAQEVMAWGRQQGWVV